MDWDQLSEQEQQAAEDAFTYEDLPTDIIGFEHVRDVWRLAWVNASRWVKARIVAEGEKS